MTTWSHESPKSYQLHLELVRDDRARSSAAWGPASRGRAAHRGGLPHQLVCIRSRPRVRRQERGRGSCAPLTNLPVDLDRPGESVDTPSRGTSVRRDDSAANRRGAAASSRATSTRPFGTATRRCGTRTSWPSRSVSARRGPVACIPRQTRATWQPGPASGRGDSVEGVLGFAETLLAHPAKLWMEFEIDQKIRFQKILFPNGLTYRNGALGTAETSVPFRLLRAVQSGKTRKG